jgi:hypothetical protein
MTLSLEEHMEKKKKEKHMKAYDAIGAAVDGLTIGTVLHILSAFTTSVLNNLDESERRKAAMVFSSILIEPKPTQEEPVQ